jgi:phosphoserine phosphatase
MIKLVVCDLDGTITRRENVWMEIHRALGTVEEARECYRRYMEGGYSSYREWAEAEASLWRGTTRERLMEIMEDIPLYSGIEDMVSGFRDRGVGVVILSSGLTILTDLLKDRYGFDHAMANELVFDGEDRVTGEVIPRVPFDGKDRVLKEYLEEVELDPSHCLAVGDGMNDIPLFRICGYGIAFNPTHNLEPHADTVVTGDDLGTLVSEFDRLSRA